MSHSPPRPDANRDRSSIPRPDNAASKESRRGKLDNRLTSPSSGQVVAQPSEIASCNARENSSRDNASNVDVYGRFDGEGDRERERVTERGIAGWRKGW